MEGLRFRPTDAELLNTLRQFTVGEYSGGLVKKEDLYGEKEPWEICVGTGTATDDDTWYFFTELKRKPANNAPGKRFFRSVGKGTWHGTSKVEKIFRDDRKGMVAGFKRNFTYWPGDHEEEEERKGEFVMNEFSLPENTLKSDRKDFVICRLKRRKKKRGPIDAAEDYSSRMILSLPEQENINNDDDFFFTYDELLGGIEVAAAAPALTQIDVAGNYNDVTYPCTTYETAVVATAPPGGVSGDAIWTLETMEDFLLKDDDDDVGGGEAAAASAAAIQEEGKAREWISSTLDDFGSEKKTAAATPLSSTVVCWHHQYI